MQLEIPPLPPHDQDLAPPSRISETVGHPLSGIPIFPCMHVPTPPDFLKISHHRSCPPGWALLPLVDGVGP